jgi:glutathione S-transferase
MALVLYDWGPSPFCVKVRAILDYKRVIYERRQVLGWGIAEVWRRGRIGKVPALDVDGELVCDSTDIAYRLEELFPEPRIVPVEPGRRASCHALEDWADESLYFIALYFMWLEPEGRALVPRAFGKGPLGRVAHRAYSRLIRRQLHGQGTARKPLAHLRADLERHVDAIEALLADSPYLLGAEPLLCDFALLGQLLYLSRTPVGGKAIAGRPRIEGFLERMKALRRPPAP